MLVIVSICLQSCNNCDKEPLKELIPNSQDNFFWWLVGLLILLAALLISARVGIYQESLTIKYGKNPEEAMYYTVQYDLYTVSITDSIIFAAPTRVTCVPYILPKYLGAHNQI